MLDVMDRAMQLSADLVLALQPLIPDPEALDPELKKKWQSVVDIVFESAELGESEAYKNAEKLNLEHRICVRPAAPWRYHRGELIALAQLAACDPQIAVKGHMPTEEEAMHLVIDRAVAWEQIAGSKQPRQVPEMTDGEFNRLVRESLHHPVVVFTISRTLACIRTLIEVLGDRGVTAFRAYCEQRKHIDQAKAQ